MYKHSWSLAVVLAGLLALPATEALAAANVEMVVIPCTPNLRPDECGVKISKTGGDDEVTFTTSSGETHTVSTGTVLSVSGTGIVSQSNQQGSIVNFASADTGLTTGSIGGGGGGGTGQTNANPSSGGNNSGGGLPIGTTSTSTASVNLTTSVVGGASSPTSR